MTMIEIRNGGKRKRFDSYQELADYAGIPYITLYMRIRAGMKPGMAIKQPVRKYRKAKATKH